MSDKGIFFSFKIGNFVSDEHKNEESDLILQPNKQVQDGSSFSSRYESVFIWWH